MLKKINLNRLLLSSVITLTMFSGCGNDTENIVGGNFIDDPVQNLTYVCSSGLTNKTDAAGTFSCLEGDLITFMIGNLKIGSLFTHGGMVTPYTLFPTNNESALNLARLLQSLDTDKSDNIISIDETLSQLLSADIDFSDPLFTDKVQGELGITLISAQEAKAKMDEAIVSNGGVPQEYPNTPPVALTKELNTLEDTPLQGTLDANDANGDLLKFIQISNTKNGTLDLAQDGTFKYTPFSNFNGTDSFSYQVADAQSESEIQNVTISISSVNDAPVITSADSFNVYENQQNAFTITASDADADTLTYSIDGDDASSFDIDSSSGVVTFKVAPDFEMKTLYTLNANVSDSNLSDTKTVSIHILNVADVIPTLEDTILSVDENATVGTTVGNVKIKDAGDSNITSFLLNDVTNFDIDANGKITTKTLLDFETKNTYNFEVIAKNSAGDSSSVNLTININDIGYLDDDGDFIPNDVEDILGMDQNNPDEDNDGILDGLQSSGIHGDQFFDKEWHIRALGTTTNDSGVATIVGNDLDVIDIYHTYMGYNHGNNIIVQVVDTGVDADHEDLVVNMDLSRSYNNEEIGDPSGSHMHGTGVAGIMAARAFNEKGVRGIIPFAKIAGSNWLDYQTYEGLEKAWLSGVGANEIAVTNNSWGSYVDNDLTYEQIMELGTKNLRDGKGRLYVFAAGNDRGVYGNGNANLSYYLSNRFVVAVAALKHDNTHTVYSSPGSNVFVSGYSGNFYQDSPTISTTTIMGESNNTGDINQKTTWSEDTEHNYTFIMNGTSSASPTVAASIALVLEACPDLTWRDVKYLIAKHAKPVDTQNETWVQNSAGLWHSVDYGFGLINAKDMIQDCTNGYTNLTAEQNLYVKKTFDVDIPDDNTTTTVSVDVNSSDFNIEWVEVTVENNSTYASDYRVELISPSGTKTMLINEGNAVSSYYGPWMDLGGAGFRFGSAAMYGEKTTGEWKVTFRDAYDLDKGTLKSIALKIYGH